MASTTDTTATADQLAALRDDDQLSWAKLAAELDLGSPGAARRLYSKLVRPHTESVLTTTARSKSGLTPLDLTDANLDAVRDAIARKTITVERAGGNTEQITVARVTSVKGGTVNFNDGDKSRSVKASAIVAAA